MFSLFRGKDKSNLPNLQTPATKNNSGLFGYLFQRVEVILLVLMAVMAYTLHGLFTEYVAKNAQFIENQTDRFYFAGRLIGSLLIAEVVLALATAFFRSKSEWDKSIFTAVIAFVIAIFNHWTIVELFKDFANAITPEARTAIEWKMLLTNWLIFILGEAIGFVMHSKGTETESVPTTANPALPDFWERIEKLFTRQAQTQSVPTTLVDVTGNPLSPIIATHTEPIGFKFGGKPHETVGKTESVPTKTESVPSHTHTIVQTEEGFLVDCPQCGKQAVKKHITSVFCSDACRKAYHKNKHKNTTPKTDLFAGEGEGL